jgi:DNA repair photolyase
MDATPPARQGRGAGKNPPNQYERLHREEDAAALDDEELRQVPTEFIADNTGSILSENDSPDVPFRYSINPYRGCEHGCIYCYARSSHEYLGYSAGLDFETKVLVKEKAPELLVEVFDRASWAPEPIALSGNTDPYQPGERQFELTRRMLQIFLEYRHPVTIITKNYLVTRDLDILEELAARNLVRVTVSVTSLRPEVIGAMEPRTSRPARRLKAIERLTNHGVPVGVNVAPVVPGLTDEELPAILKAAAKHGATRAGYVLLRLPGPVESLFIDWLEREFPGRKDKVLNRLRQMREGKLSDHRFGHRMKGSGTFADTIRFLFKLQCRKLDLNRESGSLDSSQFRRPPKGQLGLFDGSQQP